MEIILEAMESKRNYKNFQLGPISTGIRKGMITALIGRNGAGKTTFLKGLSGLSPFQEGKVTLNGQEIDFLNPLVRTKMTYISNDIQMYSDFSVKQALQFVSSLHRHWDFAWVNHWLNNFQIDADKEIHELSKGMKMKLNLILGLGHKPEIVLLDEPTDGLDSIARQQFFDLLQELMEESDRAILLSTHYTKEIENICDYALFMKNGSIHLEGVVEELKESYRVFSLPPNENLSGLQNVIAWNKKRSLEIKGMIATENASELPKQSILKTPSLDDLFFFAVEYGGRE